MKELQSKKSSKPPLWNNDRTKVLIMIWRDFICNQKAKRNLITFGKIALLLQQICKFETTISAKEVQLKVDNLRKQFRKHDAKMKNGSNPVTWCFFDSIKEIECGLPVQHKIIADKSVFADCSVANMDTPAVKTSPSKKPRRDKGDLSINDSKWKSFLKRKNCFGGPLDNWDTSCSPLKMYWKHLKKEDSEILLKNAKVSWKSLEDEKKVKFIAKSFKKLRESLEPLKKDAIDVTRILQLCPLTKHEINLYLKTYVIPHAPPKRPYILYYDELGVIETATASEYLILEAKTKFFELPEDEQFNWTTKLIKIWEEYEKNLHYLTSVFLKKFSPKVTLISGKEMFLKGKENQTKLHEVKGPVGCNRFVDAPKIPKRNSLRFTTKFLPKFFGCEFSMKKYNSLNVHIKQSLKEIDLHKKEIHVKEFLDFVNRMPEVEKKLYLGTKRRTVRRAFGYDIFEKDFPSQKYPAFIRTQSNNSCISDEEDASGDEDIVEKDGRGDGKIDQGDKSALEIYTDFCVKMDLNNSLRQLNLLGYNLESDFD